MSPNSSHVYSLREDAHLAILATGRPLLLLMRLLVFFMRLLLLVVRLLLMVLLLLLRRRSSLQRCRYRAWESVKRMQEAGR